MSDDKHDHRFEDHPFSEYDDGQEPNPKLTVWLLGCAILTTLTLTAWAGSLLWP